MLKSISPATFVTLNIAVGVVAAFALTGDWRPALAVGALQAILLRVALAMRGLGPVLAPVVTTVATTLDHRHAHRLERRSV